MRKYPMLDRTAVTTASHVRFPPFPGVQMIPASQMRVDPDDIALGQQRDPVDRLNRLVDDFGEHGEQFNPEIFGVIIIKKAERGSPAPYKIKDGGGRHLAISHLMDRPDMDLPCVIAKGDDLKLFHHQNNRLLVNTGTRFWGLSQRPENKYEFRIGKILRETREGFTTVPSKVGSVKTNNVIFAHDLGVLAQTLTLADLYWAGPKRKRRIEGIGMTGLAAFLTLFPQHDAIRLAKVLEAVSYDELKESARAFLPKNKEHQRQWGVAICKELITRYNCGVRKVKPLSLDATARIQDVLQDSPHYTLHSQVWEMRKLVE
jgi:hypothetical protein